MAVWNGCDAVFCYDRGGFDAGVDVEGACPFVYLIVTPPFFHFLLFEIVDDGDLSFL